MNKPKITAISDGVGGYVPMFGDSVTLTQSTDSVIWDSSFIDFTGETMSVFDMKPLKFTEVEILWTDSCIQVNPKAGMSGYILDYGPVFFQLYLKTIDLQRQVDSLKLIVK